MFIKILIIPTVIVAIFLAIVALQPPEFSVTRTADIPAPAAAVFAKVNDLHEFQTWSPWAKLDPACKTGFEGPSSGVGASFFWSGNSKVGEGRMTIIDSKPDELIRMKLEFVKPFAGTNTTEFTFKPEGRKTVMSWSMTGSCSFICKAMGLLMNCKKMVGDQFEQGMGNLKAELAAAPKS